MIKIIHSYYTPFFVSGQTYKISKGSNNYCSHCMSWHGTMWHSTIPGAVHSLVQRPSEDDVLFPCPLLPFPQPHWGVFFLPGGGRCTIIIHTTKCPSSKQWMPGYHSRTMPGVGKACKKCFPKVPRQGRHQVWYTLLGKKNGPSPKWQNIKLIMVLATKMSTN